MLLYQHVLMIKFECKSVFGLTEQCSHIYIYSVLYLNVFPLMVHTTTCATLMYVMLPGFPMKGTKIWLQKKKINIFSEQNFLPDCVHNFCFFEDKYIKKVSN